MNTDQPQRPAVKLGYWDFFGNLPVGTKFVHPEYGIAMVKCEERVGDVNGIPVPFNATLADGSLFIQRRVALTAGVQEILP